MSDTGRVRGALRVIELDAPLFFRTVEEINRLTAIAERDLTGADEPASAEVRVRMAQTISSMRDHLALMGAQSAWVAANRFAEQLLNDAVALKYGELRAPLRDIKSRFDDHLQFIKLFVVRGEQIPLLGSALELLGEDTVSRFRSVTFDCEEAAKCILVLRPTAAVFHSMRMLEIGIRALAKRLNVENPLKPAQRNCSTILNSIKGKIESEFPSAQRTGGSEGAFLEKIYATLDAVKNPWRNETMHVEGVYQDNEARHILANTIALLQMLASGFDEDGNRVDQPLAIEDAGTDEPVD